jgi:hypothetical protein
MARSIRPDKDKQAAEKLKILTEIRRLCISYAGLALTLPDMFGDAPREEDITSYLLQDIYTEVKLPEEFLNELARRFYDDGLIDVIGPTLNGISEEIASIRFNENYRSAIRVNYRLTSLTLGHDSSCTMQADSLDYARYAQLDSSTIESAIRSSHRTGLVIGSFLLHLAAFSRSSTDVF